MARRIDEIILHCAATKPGMDIGVKEIRQWHIEERGWRDIGYHWVIRRDGTVENGRDEDVIGAHCLNHNARSIGVCLVGGLSQDGKRPEDNFTEAQFVSLAKLIHQLRARSPEASIHGHSEFASKACPVFSVAGFLHKWGIEE